MTRIKTRHQHLLHLEKKYVFTPKVRAKFNDHIITQVKSSASTVDIILLLDYDAGIYSQNYLLINNILGIASEAGIKVIARPDKANYQLFAGVDIAKFNVNLALEIVGVNSVNETSIREIVFIHRSLKKEVKNTKGDDNAIFRKISNSRKMIVHRYRGDYIGGCQYPVDTIAFQE